jgi:hypothetical protein
MSDDLIGMFALVALDGFGNLLDGEVGVMVRLQDIAGNRGGCGKG